MIGERKHVARCSFGSDHLPLRRSSASSEAGDSHAIHERFLERIVTLYSFEDVDSVVRHADQSLKIVGDRTHESESRDSHVLHRACGARDVDGILRLVQHDRHRRESSSSQLGNLGLLLSTACYDA